MRVTLSKWLVFLMAVRPPINQFRGDTSLLKLGDYNVSMLSLWSITYLLVAFARFQHGPEAPRQIRQPIIGFMFVVLFFGVPRMYIREALILDVVAYCQFFLAALTARGIIDDLGIDYVIKRMVAGAIVLLGMHMTAAIWLGERDVVLNDIEGNYLGGFEDKHIAARSFFALIPYLVCAALQDRRSLGAKLVIPCSLFMVLALQRVSMLSAFVLIVTMVVVSKRIRVLVPMIAVAACLVLVVPSARFESFVEAKVQQEIEAYASGDLEAAGAGRMGIIFLAQDWYRNSGIADQLIGRGTAQAYQLHTIVIGHIAYAHMQIVEFMIDYGLTGTVLAFMALIRIARAKLAAFRIEKRPEELVGIAMAVVLICEMFYAMPLQDGGTITLFAFWLFYPAQRRPSCDLRDNVGITPSKG